VDDLVGKVVSALKETGEWNNTIVVFTSDNGYFNGEHRLFGKIIQYEEGIRVPLFIRLPGSTEQKTIYRFALNNDLAPTIADWANVKPGIAVDGRSLRPLIGNPDAEGWRKRFLVEFLGSIPEKAAANLKGFGYSDFELVGWTKGFNFSGVRTDSIDPAFPNYFLNVFKNGKMELYDLSRDPYQLNNRIKNDVPNLPGKILERQLNALRNCCCGNCQTAEEIGYSASPASEEEQFVQLLDSLNKAKASSFEKADEIRKYLAIRLDLGKSIDSLAFNYPKIPFRDISPFQCLELFKQNKLTALCGLASRILALLYEYAGFEAHVYECGFGTPESRHQFTLVKVVGKLIVEDAFYNITITDTNNRHKDFFKLINEIRVGDFSNVRVEQERVKSELWLDDRDELDAWFTLDSVKRDYHEFVKSIDNDGGRLKILIERDYDSFTQPLLTVLDSYLAEEKFSPNYLSVYLKPLKIIDSYGYSNEHLLNLIQSELE
jgi:hypothetical protein